jgi:hypothetical protein
MNIYRKGISGKIAEFAIKKYKSHHCVPDTIYNKIYRIYIIILYHICANFWN